MKLADIARGISAHLARMERDPKLNQRSGGRMGLSRYWQAHAWEAGAYVKITYVSFQGATAVRKADAMAYLSWLNAGHHGTHWHFQAHVAKLQRGEND